MANLDKINFMNQTQFNAATKEDNQLYLVDTSIVGVPDYSTVVNFSAGFVAEEPLWIEASAKEIKDNYAIVLVNGLTAYIYHVNDSYLSHGSGWFIVPRGGVVSVQGSFEFLRYFQMKKGS